MEDLKLDPNKPVKVVQKLYANTQWEAKQVVIKFWNIPKKKQHLIIVEPAYNDDDEFEGWLAFMNGVEMLEVYYGGEQ